MADDGFNQSTIKLASASETPLRSISYDVSAAEVDISGSEANAEHLYVAGRPNRTITYEVVGVPDTDVGDVAVLVEIAWFDGHSEQFTTGVCVGRSSNGSDDGEVTTSITFRPAS